MYRQIFFYLKLEFLENIQQLLALKFSNLLQSHFYQHFNFTQLVIVNKRRNHQCDNLPKSFCVNQSKMLISLSKSNSFYSTIIYKLHNLVLYTFNSHFCGILKYVGTTKLPIKIFSHASYYTSTFNFSNLVFFNFLH